MHFQYLYVNHINPDISRFLAILVNYIHEFFCCAYPVDMPFYSGSGGVDMNSGSAYKECMLVLVR